MKVEAIKIKNWKAISEENLTINGNNVYVTGMNGVGKSSFIDAVFKIISGKDLPTKPTKEGAKNGKIEIDLGKFIVKATFNDKNQKVGLSIESKEGAEYKAPRTMLDELAGVVDFDINSFFNLTPKNQVDFIKQLVGIDFTDLDEEYKRVYDERTFINKKLKELEAKQITFDKSTTEEQDISELQSRINEVTLINNKVREVKTRAEEREKKIKELEIELGELRVKQSRAEEWLSKNTEIDITEINNQVTEAIEYNKQVQNTKEALRLRAEFEMAIAEQKMLNESLDAIQEIKKRNIAEAKLPVPGLTFDEDQLYYNGLPFEKSQINTAQLIIIGLQINLALMKDIKIARFDGSLLDNKNIKIVEQWAKENGLQLFVEFVDRNTEGLRIDIKEENQQPVEA